MTGEFNAFLKKFWHVLLFNIGFGIFTMSMFLILDGNDPQFHVDLFFYRQAASFFVNGSNPSALYSDPMLSGTFRYLPAILYYYWFYTQVSMVTAYIISFVVSVVFRIIGFFLLHKILIFLKYNKGNLVLFIYSIVCMNNYADYGMQQVCSFINVAILASLHSFLNKKQALGSLFAGIAFFLKPVVVILLIMLVIYFLFNKKLKSAVKNIACIAIPLIPEAIIFIRYPRLINDFMEINTKTYYGFASVSFTNFFVLDLGFPGNITMACTLIIIIIIGIMILRRLKQEKDKIIFIFIYGMFTVFVVETDMWEPQLIYLFPMLAIVPIYITDKKNLYRYAFLVILIDFFGLASSFTFLPACPAILASIIQIPISFFIGWLYVEIMLMCKHKHVEKEIQA